MKTQPEFEVVPFKIIVDTREQSPWKFRNIAADGSGGKTRLIVETKRAGLKTGDYSIEGAEDRVCIERKSKEDFFGCVGGDRDRFEKQLDRVNEFERGVVVIECDWSSILLGCRNSRLKPKTIVRSVIAWQQDYFPNVHWWFCGTRKQAEVFSFRMLQRYWVTNLKGGK